MWEILQVSLTDCSVLSVYGANSVGDAIGKGSLRNPELCFRIRHLHFLKICFIVPAGKSAIKGFFSLSEMKIVYNFNLVFLLCFQPLKP